MDKYTDILRDLMNAETEDDKYDALIKAIEFLEAQIKEAIEAWNRRAEASEERKK